MGGDGPAVPIGGVGGGELAGIVQLDGDGGFFFGIEVDDRLGGGGAGEIPQPARASRPSKTSKRGMAFFMGGLLSFCKDGQ